MHVKDCGVAAVRCGAGVLNKAVNALQRGRCFESPLPVTAFRKRPASRGSASGSTAAQPAVSATTDDRCLLSRPTIIDWWY